jgi:hypothetical protein
VYESTYSSKHITLFPPFTLGSPLLDDDSGPEMKVEYICLYMLKGSDIVRK